ncbi:MAG: tetratricopeptide repeat protein [Pseudomonadota bacterium]
MAVAMAAFSMVVLGPATAGVVEAETPAQMTCDPGPALGVSQLCGPDPLCSTEDDRHGMAALVCRARNGEAEAAFLVGALHAEGVHLPYDLELAEHYLTIASNAGVAEAQHKLGLVLLWSEGTAEDEVSRALSWLSKAASQGHAMSAVVLGKLYEEGMHGVGQDLCSAQSWYRRGADLGLAPPVAVTARLAALISTGVPCQ